MRRYQFLFFITFLTSSCSTLDSEEATMQPEIQRFELVDSQLVPHFLSFETAAKERGISIDLSAAQIIGKIEELHEDNIAGQCSYISNRPNEITLDLTFWNQASNSYREYIVFHEIGHCYLNRDHLDTSLRNGACTSIMRSGTGNCQDNYNSQTRAYYLDELFSSVR